jgi:probable rRNA maturation factor
MNPHVAVDVFCDHPDGNRMCDETKRTAEYVLNIEGKNAEISIVFVGDEMIRDLNKSYLHHNDITDVISFPLEEQDDRIEGEVYICIEQAVRQAREFGVSLSNEVSRLVIHGILHLMGYDDAAPDEKSVMSDKEDRYLKELQIL